MVFQSATARPNDTYSSSASCSPRSKQKQNPTATAKQESKNSEHPQQQRQPAAAVSSTRLLPQKWHKNNSSSSSTMDEREDIAVQSPAPTNSSTNNSVAAFVAAIEATHKKKEQKADSTSKNVVQDRKINQLLCHQRIRTAGSFSHNNSSISNTIRPPTARPVVTNEERKKTSNPKDSSPLSAKVSVMRNRKTQDPDVEPIQKCSSNKKSDRQQCLSTMTAPTISMTSSITVSSSSSLWDGSATRMATASSPPTTSLPTPGGAAVVPQKISTTTTTRAPRSRLDTPPCAPPAAIPDETGGRGREHSALSVPKGDKQEMITATRSIRPSSSSFSATAAAAAAVLTTQHTNTNAHTMVKRRLADVREHRRQRYLLRMIAQQQQQQQQPRGEMNQQEKTQRRRQQQGKTVTQQQQQQQPSDEETTEEDQNFQAKTTMKTSSSKTSIERRDTIPRTSTCTSKDTTVAIKNKKPHRGIHTKNRSGNPPGLVRQTTEDLVETRRSPRKTTTTSNLCHFQDHMLQLLLQTTDTEEWVGTTASLQCEALTQHMLHFIRDDTQDRTEDHYPTPDGDDEHDDHRCGHPHNDDDDEYSSQHPHTEEKSQQELDSVFERIDHATARSSAALTQDGKPPRPPTPPRRWRPQPPHHDAVAAATATAIATQNPTRTSNRIKLHIYDLITPETRIDLWGLYHFPLGAVFNVVNSSLHSIGTGVYHVGVEVDSMEYAYGANSEAGLTGIFICPPKESPSYQYRTTIDFGDVVLPIDGSSSSATTTNTNSKRRNTTRTSRKILDRMSHEYLGTDYDLMRKNCCTFAYDLCVRLGVNEQEIPSWFHNLSSVVWSETTKPSS